MVSVAPCGWDTIPDPSCCPAWDSASGEEKARAKRWAAWLLWTATGRQLGRCLTTLRPCRRSCVDLSGWPVRPDGRPYSAATGGLSVYGRWAAAVTDAASVPWAGGMCGCGRHTCSCGRLCEIHLPGTAPEPTAIQFGAETVDLAGFRVDNGQWLVFPKAGVTLDDGTVLDCFPACQDLAAPAGAAGTWQISYRHGLPVPAEGLDAAALVACEIVKACAGDVSGCQLPSNVTSMVRNGITYEFAGNDGTVTAQTGRIVRFNISLVDMWVQSINPYGVTAPVAAWSPDMPNPGRVTTWP